MSASEANDALNLYVSDHAPGVPVVHDHFTGSPHGGFVVLFPHDDREFSRAEDHGPLAGWKIERHALVFSLTPVGFDAQIGFTLENYGKTTLAALRAEEPYDRRYWWQPHERDGETPAK